ncbi:MAG: hypothetical protein ILA04_08200 [Prevotella sp.]|nr:hypothetical protein [Prevotella sp.]
MKKERIQIEHKLHSNSENIIWSLLSTAAGMQKWIADEVNDKSHHMWEFTWGDKQSQHETRNAEILQMQKNDFIRFKWEDETDENAYIELKMNQTELTNDYILTITDHALPEDVNSIESLWGDNLAKLHQSTGL